MSTMPFLEVIGGGLQYVLMLLLVWRGQQRLRPEACLSYALANDIAFSMSLGFWSSTSVFSGSSRPAV